MLLCVRKLTFLCQFRFNFNQILTMASKSNKRKSSDYNDVPKKKLKATEEGVDTKSEIKEQGDTVAADIKNDKPHNLKIISWNVNGIRAFMGKTGFDYFKNEDPDVFCLQETKCPDDAIPAECKIKGYYDYWYSAKTKGYSGCCLFTKKKPINVSNGIGIKKHDNEGRVITAEYEEYYIVTAYVPNAGKKCVRLDYRSNEWDVDFLDYIVKLDEKKPVILCGDLNVAHQEIDLKNPKTNVKNAGFTKEERAGFGRILDKGFIDTFRHLYPTQTGAYTFWTYMMNARAKNAGWRLDYFVISKKLEEHLSNSIIHKDEMGSDHCPVVLLMNM
ncbi:uncharacterized protein LOC115215723 [Argonauta hians]